MCTRCVSLCRVGSSRRNQRCGGCFPLRRPQVCTSCRPKTNSTQHSRQGRTIRNHVLCLLCNNKPEQGKFQWVMQWGQHREEVTLRLGLQTWNKGEGTEKTRAVLPGRNSTKESGPPGILSRVPDSRRVKRSRPAHAFLPCRLWATARVFGFLSCCFL